ncbi:MAG: MucBP domain-containing protein [Clostridia bacterium]|nr:MucBP domain-containing protein [Clostridia bacterium]
MKGKLKISVGTLAISILMVIVLFFSVIAQKNYKMVMSAEDKLAMTYHELNKNDYLTQSENVRFSAFFTRDLNGDGIAEKLAGTAKKISEKDNLYMDINVLSDGTFKDGVITLSNESNFSYNMSMIKDQVLKNNYVANNIKRIELNDLRAGTQKLILGEISSAIKNINDYTKATTITLTGTHVASDGTETTINKTIDVTVDWYGEAKTIIRPNSRKVTYEEHRDTQTISVDFKTQETKQELVLKDTVAIISIPNLNGYEPEQVTGGDYNPETKTLTITREAEVDENGNITKSLSRINNYNFNITYPQEAFYNERLEHDYAELDFTISAYYEGYNNNYEEFENPYKTETEVENCLIVVEMKEIPEGYIYKYEVKTKFTDKEYRYRTKDYALSKQAILDAYDKETSENYQYNVAWNIKFNVKEDYKYPITVWQEEADKLGSIDLSDYTKTTAIYFSNFRELLGVDGTISVYNYETNALIKTFTLGEANKYNVNNPYKFETPVKLLKFVTSSTNNSSSLNIYNIKEIDVKALKENISKEDLYEEIYLTTYVVGTIDSDERYADADTVNFTSEKSYATLSVNNSKLIAQNEDTNRIISIRATSTQLGDAEWKNGIFIVEIPEEIVKVQVNSINTDSNNVEVLGYDLTKENGKYYLKVLTENEEIVDSFTVNVDAELIPDARVGTKYPTLKLYYHNDNCKDYYDSVQDRFDINDNSDIYERIGYNSSEISIIAPTSLVTMQIVSNYDEEESTTVAPNVAEITKETRSADIEIVVNNNYEQSITDTIILGKVPYENNKYVLNNNFIGSVFSATMNAGGITVPDEISEKTKVYYTEVGEPTEDVTLASNEWKTASQVTDWTKIKAYLIDLSEYTLGVGKTYSFKYGVTVPSGLNYNDASYATHAVYYNYNSDNGTIALQTEPEKVGIRVARTFDMEITKYKEAKARKVQGATYSLIEKNNAGEEVASKILVSNNEGLLKAKGLYVDAEYELKEIKAPANYILSTSIIKFKVVEKEDGELEFVTLSEDNFNSTPSIVNEDGKDVVKTTIANEPKYQLNVTVMDKTVNQPIVGAILRLGNTLATTNLEGKVEFKRFLPNTDYTLSEMVMKGYYLEDYDLILEKDNLTYTFEHDETLKFISIENDEENDLIQVNVLIEKEGAPRYDLDVVKVESDITKNNLDDMNKLEGAKYEIYDQDSNEILTYTTNENGTITLNNLYQYVAGKAITGKYTIKEVTAPDGYILNTEEITFIAKTENDELKVDLENRENLTSIKDVKIEGNKVILILQDSPYFKLTKTDSKTGEPIANVKFAIYELNDEEDKIGFAKDINGNYVGTLNAKGVYEVITNESGIISLPLGDGKYQVEELEAPEGYTGLAVEKFEIKNGVKTEIGSQTEDDEDESYTIPEKANTLEINYIEDLLTLATNVANGNTYSDTKVILKRDLDFEDDESYRDANNTTTYGDYNEDEVVESIKTELTTGKGFTGIGIYNENYDYSSRTYDFTGTSYFSGVFDGQNHKIKNMYSDRSCVGLFGFILDATVVNTGVTGTLKGTYCGGIAAQASGDVLIVNCNNETDITGSSYSGGILGQFKDAYIHDGDTSIEHQVRIINCYNKGYVDSYQSGGIVGKIEISYMNYKLVEILNCYNDSEVRGCGITVEISVRSDLDYERVIKIKNCYNKGNFNKESTSYKAGIASSIFSTKNTTFKLINSYNLGNYNEDAYTTGSGLVFDISMPDGNVEINNCYNKGNISRGSGLIHQVYSSKNTIIKNSYNEGKFSAKGWAAGGIVGSFYFRESGKIENCYNIGSTSLEGTSEVGGLVARCSSGLEVRNSFNTGDIYGSSIVGGIIGNGSQAIIDNCYNTGKITSDGNYSAGIIAETSNTTITNCKNSGEIIGSGQYIAGIAGQLSGSITKCLNEGNINTRVGRSVGGIVGSTSCASNSDVIIDSCISKGKIYNEYGDYTYIGGIVGEGSEQLYVLNCVNYSDIYDNSATGYIGGIQGAYYAYKIENCYNYGNITAINTNMNSYTGGILCFTGSNAEIENVFNKGNILVNNAKGTGGILGYNTNTVVVENAYNEGNITVIGDTAENIGGIVGNGKNATIKNVYNEGTLIGNKNVAGIIGKGENVEISKVYNIGDIISNTDEQIATIYAEDVFVENESSVSSTNVYYLDSIKLKSENVLKQGTTQMWEEMTTEDFYNTLNTDRVWLLRKWKAPTIDLKIPAVDNGIVTELNITNVKLEFNISTAVNGYGGTISGQNEKTYEVVAYKEDNTKVIEIVPQDGYKVGNITVNGNGISFTTDEDGKVILPAGYFSSMTENKKVIVTFAREDISFTVQKVDEETGEGLAGATLKVSNYNGDSWTSTVEKFSREANSKIGTLTVPDGAEYGFIEKDGKYVNTNSSNNDTLAFAYVPIDLRSLPERYRLTVNFEFSGDNYDDEAYLYLTETNAIPDVSNSNNRITTVYSNYSTSDYKEIDGGKLYYLYFAYKKYPTSDLGEDEFKITDISVKYSDNNKFSEIVNTPEDGKVSLSCYGDKIFVEETEAPEGYELDSTVHEFDLETSKEFVVTNKKEESNAAQVIAHYYLKGTTDRVAEDEVLYGKVGEEYLTTIKKLEGLNIEKDINGIYKIPTNAAGTYVNEIIEVDYYYEAQDIELVIHHYKEGTEEKLVEDETIKTAPRVIFDDEGNYQIDVSESYKVSENNNYRTLIRNDFSFVDVNSTADDEVTIDGTLTYNEDSELIYTYEEKEYTIATKVEKHEEIRVNSETGEEESKFVAGGTISGDGMQTYEIVNPNEDATKDIVVRADEGYVISSVIIKTVNDDGSSYITTLYGENADEEEITYTGDDKEITLSKFTNMTANKLVIVKFEPFETRVVVHHILENTNEEYRTQTIIGNVGDNYTTEQIEIPGYVFKQKSNNFEGRFTEEKIDVYYYYGLKDSKIIIKYVDKRTNEEIADAEELNGKYSKEVILTEYEKDIEGYTLVERPEEEKVYYEEEEKTYIFYYSKNAKVRVMYIEKDTELKLSEDELIEGYEGKEYTTDSKEFDGYELVKVPNNANGVMTIIINEDGTIDDEILVIYEYVKLEVEPEEKIAKVIVKHIDINSKEVLYDETIKGKVDDQYETESKNIKGYVLVEKDKNGKSMIPLNAKGKMTEEDIEVIYYYAKEAKVIVRYVEKHTNKEVAEQEEIEGYEGEEYTTKEKVVKGYEHIETKGNKNGEMKAGETIVTYYYAKKATGIIPQTGINVFLYVMHAIVLIIGANVAIVMTFKMRK